MNTETLEALKFRTKVKNEDLENVRNILSSREIFHDDELEIANELVEETLEEGSESPYLFVFAEIDGKTAGYSCFGRIPCTKYSWDLYWIGVHHDYKRLGLGKILVHETEKIIKENGGKYMYIETSSRERYSPTHSFYDSCDCKIAARIKDFYDEGDDKLLYKKCL